MKRKIASIVFLSNNIVLEGLSNKGLSFEDVVLCCQFLLEQNFDKEFIESHETILPKNIKRKINLYEEKQHGILKYWWGFEKNSKNVIDMLKKDNIEDVLVGVLRNNIYDGELSKGVLEKYSKDIKDLSNIASNDSFEEKIISYLRKLLRNRD